MDLGVFSGSEAGLKYLMLLAEVWVPAFFFGLSFPICKIGTVILMCMFRSTKKQKLQKS